MILVVGNTKGGTGKTTLAVNIAIVLARQGRDVLLIDGDEQASAATFAQLRAEVSPLAPPTSFTTVQLQGAAIRQQIRQLQSKYDEVVIDVGGRDTGSLRAALTVADTLLVPFQPRSVDLWAGAQIASLVAEARELNEGLRVCAMLNIADPAGQDNADASMALQTLDGFEALQCLVVRRKAFPNAFTSGLSVVEQNPSDPKAVSELLSVVNALYTQGDDNGHHHAPQREAGL